MYSAMCNRLALKHESDDTSNSKVSLKTLDITRQTIEMFIIQFYEVNKKKAIGSNNESESTFKYSFQMIAILDKHLDWLIDLNTQENFRNISGLKYSKGSTNMTKSKQTKIPTYKYILDQINSMHCLFTWNLQTFYSKKDIISHIKKKYGNYNLDISLPVFTFERYISNIIISFELFHKNEKETAKIILLSIGKWLEELDKSTDDFYLLISDGLKYVLLSTLAYMMRTNLAENIHWLLDFIPFSDISYHSKAAVHAIEAAVLIEYGYNEDCFKKAVKCINIACNLDPNVPYWFYLHSLVLRAHRQFLLTYKSCPTEDERSTIQQAISLSNVQNIYFMYHEITLFKDTILHDFHKNKNEINKHEVQKEKHLSKEKNIILMIKKLICREPTDPLILINCVKILRTLKIIVHDLNFEKKLLIRGLQLAPNDLAVLKAIVVQIIVHYKQTIKNNKSSQDQHLKINEQACLGDDLKFAVEKHRIGEDPVLHLTRILNNYDSLTQWKILAQICSYTILFKDNLKDGLKIFMMLVEAEENKMVHSDLILRHFSSFADKHKKFNLAQLVCEKIKVQLSYNNDNYEKRFYTNNLFKIVSKYDIDINTVRSMEYNLIKEIRNRKSRNKNVSKNNVNYNDNTDNTNLIEDDNSYEDVNSDDSIYSVSDVNSNDDNDRNNNDNCCMCKIM